VRNTHALIVTGVVAAMVALPGLTSTWLMKREISIIERQGDLSLIEARWASRVFAHPGSVSGPCGQDQRCITWADPLLGTTYVARYRASDGRVVSTDQIFADGGWYPLFATAAWVYLICLGLAGAARSAKWLAGRRSARRSS